MVVHVVNKRAHQTVTSILLCMKSEHEINVIEHCSDKINNTGTVFSQAVYIAINFAVVNFTLSLTAIGLHIDCDSHAAPN